MSNDSKTKGALASLKKSLAETDGPTVLVDREVIESLAQEISRQNNLLLLETLKNDQLIELSNMENLVEEVALELNDRELTTGDLIYLLKSNSPVCEFAETAIMIDLGLEDCLQKLFWALDLEDEEEEYGLDSTKDVVSARDLLDLWEQLISDRDISEGENNWDCRFSEAIIARTPNLIELREVRETLENAKKAKRNLYYGGDGEMVNNVAKAINKVSQQLREKELFEEAEAEAEAEALKKARSSMSEEELENLRRAFQRLAQSDSDSDH